MSHQRRWTDQKSGGGGLFASVPSSMYSKFLGSGRDHGPTALCVEMAFTWTFSRNQDATVKLKSELISFKF